jgi:hypothetical protein
LPNGASCETGMDCITGNCTPSPNSVLLCASVDDSSGSGSGGSGGGGSSDCHSCDAAPQ